MANDHRNISFNVAKVKVIFVVKKANLFTAPVTIAKPDSILFSLIFQSIKFRELVALQIYIGLHIPQKIVYVQVHYEMKLI